MKIVITHGYSDLNKGDVAIALGTLKAIHRVWPTAQIKSQSNFSEKHVNFLEHTYMMRQFNIPVTEGTLPSPYVEDDSPGLLSNIKAGLRLLFESTTLAIQLLIPILRFLHPRKARALDDLREADLVIIRGGQYLHNESGRIRGFLFLGRMLINIAVPIWLRKPAVIWGLSIGPVRGCIETWCLSHTIRACRKIIVREKFSAEYLHQLGIIDNVTVSPDLAFLTIPTPVRDSCEILLPRPRIAVTVINWTYPGHKQPQLARKNYIDAILTTLVNAHREHGLNVMIFQQVTAQHHGQGDSPLVTELVSLLKSIDIPVQVLPGDLTPGELCMLYGGCEVGIATRLHAIILAACAGLPSIGISYQGFKTRGIMEELGLGQYVKSIDGVTSEALFRDLNHILIQGVSLRNKVSTRVIEFQREIDSAGVLIAEAIGSPT